MLKRLKFIATLMCLSLSVSIFAEELVFIKDDLRTGMNRASGEGKLVFLEFWASYCTPCKIMEEYTFTNTSVIESMNNGYVPVKVNIESFEGFDLKNQYKITVLPTIIILDSKGRLVARYEETMSATKLSSILNTHNQPKNRTRFAPTAYNNAGFNTSANKPTNSVATTSAYNRPPSPKESLRTVPAPVPVNARIVANNNMPQHKPTAAATSAPTSSDIGERRTIPTTGFTVQTGAYGNAKSAQQVIEKMKAKSGSQKQYIMQSKINGKVTYRVFVGNFASRQEAETFRKNAAIEGYVRGFTDFVKKN